VNMEAVKFDSMFEDEFFSRNIKFLCILDHLANLHEAWDFFGLTRHSLPLKLSLLPSLVSGTGGMKSPKREDFF
jgi:hypothetical protein